MAIHRELWSPKRVEGEPRRPQKRARGEPGGAKGSPNEPKGEPAGVTRGYRHEFRIRVLHCKKWGLGTNGRSTNRGVRSENALGRRWRSTESSWTPKRIKREPRGRQKIAKGSPGGAKGNLKEAQGEPRGGVLRVTRDYSHVFGTPALHFKNWCLAQTGGQRIKVLGPRTHFGDNGGPQRARGAPSESKESPGDPKREPGGAQGHPKESQGQPRGAQKKPREAQRHPREPKREPGRPKRRPGES